MSVNKAILLDNTDEDAKECCITWCTDPAFFEIHVGMDHQKIDVYTACGNHMLQLLNTVVSKTESRVKANGN